MINIYTLGMAGTLCSIYLFKGMSNVIIRKKLFLWMFIIFWGSVMAFRALSVGTDTFNYAANIFPRILEHPLTSLSEFKRMPIYTIYNKLVGMISKDSHAIIIFTSFIYVTGVLLFLYYNSENFYMSCFYFLSFAHYFYAMNTARQSLAMMLVLWVYHFTTRKRLILSVLMVVLAIGIHATAIVGVIIVILNFINLDRTKSIITLLVGCALTFAFELFFNLFVRLFPSYAGYLNTSSVRTAYGTSEGNRLYVALVLLVLFATCYYWKWRKRILFHDENTFWLLFTLSMIGIVFMTLLRYSATAARVEYYFTYFFMLFLPICIERFFDKKSRYIVYGGTIFVFLILFYIRIQPFLPYVFWE